MTLFCSMEDWEEIPNDVQFTLMAQTGFYMDVNEGLVWRLAPDSEIPEDFDNIITFAPEKNSTKIKNSKNNIIEPFDEDLVIMSMNSGTEFTEQY